MKKRILSLAVCLAMVLSLLPAAALAADPDETTAVTIELSQTVDGLGSVYDVGQAPMLRALSLDTSAFTWSDGGKAYYNQLDKTSKKVYDAILASDLGTVGPNTIPVSLGISTSVTGATITTDGTSATLDDETQGKINDWLDSSITPAVLALIYDQPKLSWLVNMSYSQGPQIKGFEFGGQTELTGQTVEVTDVTFTLKTANSKGELVNTTGDMAAIESAISTAKTAINEKLAGESTAYDTVKAIHDYVCDTVAYTDDSDLTKREYQTVYSALVGNGQSENQNETVCAGYAKAFKVLCDEYRIPCVLVSGQGVTSQTGPEGEAHMWNYVRMDGGSWYAVDCTWDDQIDVIYYDFFLAGGTTVDEHFGGSQFSTSHQASGVWSTGYTFNYPDLYSTAYSEPATLTEITVALADGQSGDVAVPVKGQTATVRLKATANYDDASAPDVTAEAAWSLKDGPVTGVSVANGLVTIQPTAAAGEVTIQATYQDKTGEVTITLTKDETDVIAELGEIEGSGTATIPATGLYTADYSVEAYNKYGEKIASGTGAEVTWSVNNSNCSMNTGSINDEGAFQSTLTVQSSAAEGSITITAAAEYAASKTKSVTLEKEPSKPDSVTVTPPAEIAAPEVSGIGQTEQTTEQMQATVYDQYGEPMSGQSVEWSITSQPAGISIDPNTGKVTVTNRAAAGDYAIKATCGEVSDTATLTVTKNPAAAFVQILKNGQAIPQDSITIPTGEDRASVTYDAEVYDQYGVLMNDQSVNWTNNNADSNVTVADGTVTVNAGAQPGDITLTATCGGPSATITITLTDKPDAGVSISGPTSVTYSPNGTFPLTASASNPGSGGTWSWESDQPDVLTVSGTDATVTVTIKKAGTANISVTYDSDTAYGTASVSVTVNRADIDGAAVVCGGPYTYNGSVQTPAVDVTLNGTPLTLPDDYTVSYSPATVRDAGTYTVTVTGANNYQGTASGTFTIEQAEPTVGNVTRTSAETIYTSTDPAAVTLSHDGTPGTVKLAEGTQFTAGEGSYTWVFTPGDTQNYKTATGSISLTVTPNALGSIELTAAPSKTAYQFGQAFDPAGMSVTAHYANGDAKELDNSALTVAYQNGSAFAVGDTKVTLSYTEAGVTQSCEVTGLTVSKAAWQDQSDSVELLYNQTAAQTVSLAGMLPANCGTVAISGLTGTSALDGFFQSVSEQNGNIVFQLGSGLTEGDAGKTGAITFTVQTQNYEDFDVTVTVTLTKLTQHTITFNANGGTGAMNAVTVNSGETYKLPACGFTAPSGMQFKCWAFSTADGNQYDPGESMTFSADAVFYAVWEKIPSSGGDSGSSGGSSSGGSSSGSSSSSDSKTETVKNPDGSTTTTVTDASGNKTETTRYADGSVEKIETKKNGTVTTTLTDAQGNKTQVVENPDGSSKTTVDNKDGSGSVTTVDENGVVNSQATLSEKAIEATESGAPVTLPMPSVRAAADTATAPAITVDLPAGTTVKVEIPVTRVTAGTVAVLVSADGSEEVVRTSVSTDSGIAVTVSDGDTIKIVENSKNFSDVSGSYWGADAIDFASSRELFAGTSDTTFGPEEPMNRAMIVTVLARFEGVDTSVGSTWYEVGRQWAMVNGISDGSDMFNNLTREQLATMLWRYVGSPAASSSSLNSFADAGNVSGYAVQAMAWAVEQGLFEGNGDNTLNPQGSALRVEVATILMRFIENIAA